MPPSAPRARSVTPQALIVIVDADRTIRFASTGWGELLSLSTTDLIGRRVLEFLPDPIAADGLLHHLGEGGALPVLVTVEGPAGLRHAVEVFHVERIELPWGREPASLVLARETQQGRQTDLATLDARLGAMDRLASVGVLAAGVVHDLNNLLVYLSVRLRQVDRDVRVLAATAGLAGQLPAIHALHELQDAVDRLATMTHDLKGFSMAAQPEQFTTLDLREVLSTALRFTRHEVAARARVSEEYLDPPLVRGVELELTQVFVNLLLNAAHAVATDTKDAEHSIQLRAVRSADGRAVVEVRDTGCGMSQPVLDALFTPYFTTKPRGVGTGLGLWMAHRIVERHGGEIVVDSRLGGGTTFRVILPAAPASPSGSAT